MPTAEEITKNQSHYLDATINEILRLASSIAVLDRQTSCDTELLGHHIPKGTIIMMLNRGPSFTEPALPIDESLRSPTCQAAALRSTNDETEWLYGNEDQFIPDRWLRSVPQTNRDTDIPTKDISTSSHSNKEPGDLFGPSYRLCDVLQPSKDEDARPSSPPSELSTPNSKGTPQSRIISCEPRKDRRVPKYITCVPDACRRPSLPFGLGQRGCYGKKLALLELKIVFTLLIWNFELVKCPEELSGYAAVETLTHKPRQCFVSLRKLDDQE